jgi:RNA 2',3'-cyclic 3'-phosphodiesterase
MDLLGGGHAPAEVHRLFFALFPSDAVRDRLIGVAAKLQAEAVRASWIEPSRYHATLHFLGDYSMLRPDLIDAAKKVAQSIRCAPFTWTLDRVASFRGQRPPCIMRSEDTPAPLQLLWDDMRQALILERHGQQIVNNFTPHVTLGYGQAAIASKLVEPIDWSIDGFALVHSLVGRSEYRILDRWSLLPRQ